MDRREFLQKSAAASMAVALKSRGQKKPNPRKPNLLYVFSDQHRACALPGEHYNQAIAPNIDAFRHQNFSMETCVSNYPLCTPYRGIFMSGRWPCQTGLVTNGVPLSIEEVSIGDTFKSNGYHTGYIGKWHLAGPERGFIPAGPRRFGFEDWHVWSATNNHYGSWTYDPDTGQKIQPEGYNATLMTDQAVKFLGEQPKNKPWMLVLSWNPPHPPFNPPPTDRDRYQSSDLKLRPNVRLAAPGQKMVGINKYLVSQEDLRTAEQGYYGAITAIDLEFARVLKALEESGHADNTIVIYTSDHGEMMGSHGHMAKQMPHEESCRVPFFVRYPGVTPNGGKSNILFSAIDIYPTLCGLAGIPVPGHCGGRDLSAAMRGEKITSQEVVFLMNDTGKPGTQEIFQPGYRGARTLTHTYAVMATGRWCLYDNAADPYQLNNLIKDPAQAPLIQKLDAMIQVWMQKTGDNFPYKQALGKYSNYPDYPDFSLDLELARKNGIT